MFVPTQQAKEGHVGTDLEPYEIDGNEVRGGKVLIVDDVYKSGISMRSVAKAAVDAGATSVLGIVGARTLATKRTPMDRLTLAVALFNRFGTPVRVGRHGTHWSQPSRDFGVAIER